VGKSCSGIFLIKRESNSFVIFWSSCISSDTRFDIVHYLGSGVLDRFS
jgi:hypothetical protein